jgi:hypothetical protein
VPRARARARPPPRFSLRPAEQQTEDDDDHEYDQEIPRLNRARRRPFVLDSSPAVDQLTEDDDDHEHDQETRASNRPRPPGRGARQDSFTKGEVSHSSNWQGTRDPTDQSEPVAQPFRRWGSRGWRITTQRSQSHQR